MTHTKNFPTVFNLMDRFFHDDFITQAANRPEVNIRETDDAFHMELLAPGLTKQDIQVQIDQQVLTISYEKKESAEESKPQYIRREFSNRSFKRSFTLTEKINAEGIMATYENGILHITLPKTAQKENKVKILSIQ